MEPFHYNLYGKKSKCFEKKEGNPEKMELLNIREGGTRTHDAGTKNQSLNHLATSLFVPKKYQIIIRNSRAVIF